MAEETQQDQQPRQHHDRGSYHNRPRDHTNLQPRPPGAEQQPPAAPAGDSLDAADDDEERAQSQQHRSHGGGHRGGRQPKKVYEEFINDPYCE